MRQSVALRQLDIPSLSLGIFLKVFRKTFKDLEDNDVSALKNHVYPKHYCLLSIFFGDV